MAIRITDLRTSVTFDENDVNTSPALIDSAVTVEGDLLPGTHITLSGLLPEDAVTLRDEGDGAGQIGLDGTTVSYEGVTIGSVMPGAATEFTVVLNDAASTEAVEALLENLTYANESDVPTVRRTLSLSVTDDHGVSEQRPSFAENPDAPTADIDIGDRAAPTAVDLDGDGDTDLVIGRADGRLSVFRNDAGTPTELTSSANPFDGIDVGDNAKPTFVDLDGDRDTDLVVGQDDGKISAWRNDGGVFTPLTGRYNPFNGIDVGDRATPSFADLDGDARPDLVVGAANGRLSVWTNTPDGFVAQTGTSNPFNGIDVGSESTPVFADLDRDGRIDLIVGESGGELRFYQNTTEGFVLRSGDDSPFDGIDIGSRSAPTLADIDADGQTELLVGGSDGEITAFDDVTPDLAIRVTVTPQNDAPEGPTVVTLADTLEDTTTTITNAQLLSGWTDPDGDSLTVEALTVSSGTVTQQTGGVWRFQPAANANGEVTFTYRVSDGHGGTATGKAKQSVGFQEDPPTIEPGERALRYVNDPANFVVKVGASSPDGQVTFSLSGDDAGKFTVDINGKVYFRQTPDDDVPGDANGDGTYSFNVVATVGNASTSVAYTAVVQNIPETATLTGFGPSVTFAENTVNAAPQRLDTDVTFTPGDSLTNAVLRVSGLKAEDSIGLANLGTGPGQIGISGNSVLYGGTAIGTFAGGSGADFTVTLNAAARGPSVEALIEALTYADVSDTPTAARTLTLSLAGGVQQPNQAWTIGVNVTAQTEPPRGPALITLPAKAEDTPFTLTSAALLAGWSDPDSPSFSVRNLSASAGTLQDNSNGTWTYTPAKDDDSFVTFTYEVWDNTWASAGKAIYDITAVNDGPVITSANAWTFAENRTGVVFRATATDAESAVTWSTPTSRFSVDAATGEVRFSFAPDFEAPQDSNRDNVYDLTLQASDGVLVTTQNVTVTVTNATMELSGLRPSFTVLENTAQALPTWLDTSVSFLSGGANLNGAVLKVRGLLPEDVLGIQPLNPLVWPISTGSGGAVFYKSTPTGTPFQVATAAQQDDVFSVTFNSRATQAAVENVIEALTYKNTSDTPTPSHTLVIELTSPDGTTLNGPQTARFVAAANPLNGLDVGYRARPTFVDLDQDGRLDLVIGQDIENSDPLGIPFRVFRGTSDGFVELTGANNPLAGLASDIGRLLGDQYVSDFAPTFVDVDRDGRLDIISATRTYNASLPPGITEGPFYWHATATGYERLTGYANPFTGGSLNIGWSSVAAVADLKGDGSRYLVVSGNSGGTANDITVLKETTQGWVLQTDANNPLAGLTFTQADGTTAELGQWQDAGFAFFDLDGDGRQDLVYGTSDGRLVAFRNTSAGFVPLTGSADPFAGILGGRSPLPAFGDADGDGDADLIIGDILGNFTYYRNDTPRTEITVNITPENDAPRGPASITLPALAEDTPVTITAAQLLAGSRDPEGAILSVRSLTVSSGALVDNGNGTWRFTPAANDDTAVTFSYQVSDGAVSTATTASLDLTPVNDPPTGPATITLTPLVEDTARILTSATLLAGWSDVEGPLLVATLVASSGTLVDLGSGSWRFTPRTNDDGSVTFGYFATDGVNARPVVATLDLTPVNDAPVITSASAATFLENGTGIAYQATGIDVDSTITWRLSGRDQALFTLDAQGALRFRAAPDFETPRDADGDNAYVVTITADDGLLQASRDVTVTVADQREYARLDGLAPGVSFGEQAVNAGPRPLLPTGFVFTRGDTLDHAHLTVSGLLPEDRVGIAHIGNGPGEIGVDGATLRYGGAVIGTAAGGAGGTLTVTLTAAADGAAVQALLRALTYADVSDTPTATRSLTIDLEDSGHGRLNAPLTPDFGDFAADPFAGIDVGARSAPAFTDLDGDGNLDLVVGEKYGSLAAFRNTGTGWQALTGSANPFAGILVGQGASPTFVDLDGDGALDLVVGDDTGAVQAWRRDVDGSFHALTDAADPFDGIDGTKPSFVDLHGDGRAELVLGGGVGGGLQALTRTGAGWQALTGAANPFAGIQASVGAPVFTDLDRDGRLDLVLGNGEGTILAWHNAPTGFVPLKGSANPFFGIDLSFSAPTFADLDGDGRPDLVSGTIAGRLVAWRDVTVLGAPITVTVAAANDALAVGAAIGDQRSPEDSAWRFTLPTGAFTDPDDSLRLAASLDTGAPLPSWLSFDAATGRFAGTPPQHFNGSIGLKVTATDGANTSASQGFTLVVTPVNDAPVVGVAIGPQSSPEDAAWNYTLPAGAFTDVDTGDTLTLSATLANGTALPAWLSFDAATGRFAGTPPLHFTGSIGLKVTATDTANTSASQGFTLVVTESLPSTDRPVLLPTAPHDLDGNGVSDILWRNDSGTLVAWKIAALNGIGSDFIAQVDPSWSVAGNVDFTGDGSPDILWRHTNGATVLWTMNGTTPVTGINFGVIDPSWQIAATVGANGAGDAEILWRNTNGDTVIWTVNNGVHTADTWLGHVETSWSIAGTGNFFGNGNADILWRNTNGDTVIWQMNGPKPVVGASLGFVDPSWKVGGIADFDGKGYADILWRNTSGETVIWQMNGFGRVAASDLGVIDPSWSIAATGDYDGNGSADILWRNSNGATAIWQMQGSTMIGGGLNGSVPTDWHIVA